MPATFTAREYNHDASRVKRAANDGPVIITQRGKPAHVMMTMAAYERLKGNGAKGPNLADLLSCPEIANVGDPPGHSREIDPRDLRRDELDR